MISIVNTTSGEKVGDVKVDGDTLEALALESRSPNIYVSNRAKNEVTVVDRREWRVVGSWPITKGKVLHCHHSSRG
jgi:hypothetical protein